MDGLKKYAAKTDITQGLIMITKHERVWGELVFNEGRRYIKVQGQLMPAEWFSKL